MGMGVPYVLETADSVGELAPSFRREFLRWSSGPWASGPLLTGSSPTHHICLESFFFCYKHFLSIDVKPDVVALDFNFSTWEAEERGSGVQG